MIIFEKRDLGRGEDVGFDPGVDDVPRAVEQSAEIEAVKHKMRDAGPIRSQADEFVRFVVDGFETDRPKVSSNEPGRRDDDLDSVVPGSSDLAAQPSVHADHIGMADH